MGAAPPGLPPAHLLPPRTEPYRAACSRFGRRDPLLSYVGRLDKETSGLLLLTDDGKLQHRIKSPKAAIWKARACTPIYACLWAVRLPLWVFRCVGAFVHASHAHPGACEGGGGVGRGRRRG